MSGTSKGGQLAYQKNIAKDPDFYAKIGRKGGQNGTTGGFASDKLGADGLTGRERAKKAGAAGGRISRRTKAAVVSVQQEDQTTQQAA